MSRFPFGTPLGWYPVAWSADLARGEVSRLHAFGRELVAFRGESGEAHVLDAHCPHLGAHLGVGGRVEGDALRCPFHGWRFAGDGRCVAIPYAKRIPPGARAGAHPTREGAGAIWVWHHPRGEAPTWEPPAVPEYGAAGWAEDWLRYDYTVRTHPQEIAENSVDWPHFHHVHEMEPPGERTVRFEGHEILWEARTSKAVSTLDGREDHIHVIGRNPGLGCSYVRYTGLMESVILMGMTPVDGEHTHMLFGVLGKMDPANAEESHTLLKAYADDMAHALTQDFPIWENKLYRASPRLCDGDGPVGRFRRWASQFYVEGEAAPG